MAVGMAMAERHLAVQYNRPGYPLVDHYTYSIVGDGDLMEGVAEEAINLAGKNRLGHLIVLYDSNDVTLDGPLSLSTNESAAARFKAAHWDYQLVEDSTDLNAIAQAIRNAQQTSRPSLIEVKTIIGYNTPRARIRFTVARWGNRTWRLRGKTMAGLMSRLSTQPRFTSSLPSTSRIRHVTTRNGRKCSLSTRRNTRRRPSN